VQLPIVDKFRGTVADRVKFGLFCSKKSDKDWGFPIGESVDLVFFSQFHDLSPLSTISEAITRRTKE
jgi:hypothetical protein